MILRTIASLCFVCITGCVAVKPTHRINFTAPDTYPEGIAYDSEKKVFYVSSQRDGSVGIVTRAGAYSKLLEDTSLKSSYGLKLHPDGKKLYLCTADANYSKFTSADTRKLISNLVIIDLMEPKKIQKIDLSKLVPGKHFANDLTFDKDGNAYVTDSYAHAIYKVTPDGKATVFAKHKQFETEGFGVNGIVFHPAGFLLVDNSNTGQIYKIQISDPGVVTRVQTEQYFLGADGLLLNDTNMLTVVTNGGNDKIFQLKSDDQWKTARLHATTILANRFTYPTTATLAGDSIWVMNAKSNELLDSNAVPAKIFAIQYAKPIPLPK